MTVCLYDTLGGLHSEDGLAAKTCTHCVEIALLITHKAMANDRPWISMDPHSKRRKICQTQ